MQYGKSNKNRQENQPQVPDWIRDFRHPNWTNVFHLVPNNKSLYPVALRADWKSHFNDWNGRILLLAKDGCPTRVIHDRVNARDPQPWRYGQRELGDEMGWRTNERLYRFASAIPGGKLYGSAAAHMLYDDPRSSRKLKGFKSDALQKFLQRVLGWVVQSMPHVEWVACLGEEAWFLTCTVLGNSFAASNFKDYRDSCRPVAGLLDKKEIAAFPLYHPAALGNAINEMNNGWRAFATALRAQKGTGIYDELFANQRTNRQDTNRIRQGTKRTLPTNEARNAAPRVHRIVTAILPRRLCRVQFRIAQNVVHTSPQYDSGNTWANIIAFARTKRGGAPLNLSRAVVAIPQVLTPNGWVDATSDTA
jgi:hypothetical protein